MKENFDSSFTALIGNEGGYSNNPNDPGQETMYGITKRVAVAHGYTGEMKDLPLETAKEIAKAEYWDPCGGDDLPGKLDFTVFDAAYNSGVSRAKEWLAKALSVRDTADGSLNVPYVIMRFDGERLLFLDSLPTWPSFGRGWARRIAENLLRATS